MLAHALPQSPPAVVRPRVQPVGSSRHEAAIIAKVRRAVARIEAICKRMEPLDVERNVRYEAIPRTRLGNPTIAGARAWEAWLRKTYFPADNKLGNAWSALGRLLNGCGYNLAVVDGMTYMADQFCDDEGEYEDDRSFNRWPSHRILIVGDSF